MEFMKLIMYVINTDVDLRKNSNNMKFGDYLYNEGLLLPSHTSYSEEFIYFLYWEKYGKEFLDYCIKNKLKFEFLDYEE